MANFGIAYERTAGYEGGAVHHALDRGGQTFHGIARRAHPDWPGWAIVDRANARQYLDGKVKFSEEEQSILAGELRRLYLREYWQRVSGDILPDQDVANEVYDSAVNVGVGRASEWLQQSLNVCNNRGQRWPDIKVDGDIGPTTAATVAKACAVPVNKWLVLQVMESYQRAHYVHLAATDPTQEAFLLGWFRLRVQWTTPPP